MGFTFSPSCSEAPFLSPSLNGIALKQHAFQLRNDSGGLVEVAAIETSCPCASIRLEQTSIPVGQFLAGELTLDMGRESDFAGNLAIEVKGLTRHRGLAFKLTVWAHVYPAAKAD
jgi:hypothetical protein